MTDYTLPMMLAREQIRVAEEAVEDNDLNEAANAVMRARGHLIEALVALETLRTDHRGRA